MTTPNPFQIRPRDEELPAGDAGTPLSELATAAAPVDSRTLPGSRVRVHLADGSSWEVRYTNRDYLRWDKTPAKRRGAESFQAAPFVFATFLAWSASAREGLTELDWAAFQEAVEEVERLEATADEPDDVPPTR